MSDFASADTQQSRLAFEATVLCIILEILLLEVTKSGIIDASGRLVALGVFHAVFSWSLSRRRCI